MFSCEYFIANEGDFDTKIKNTIAAIGEVMGVAVYIEKERKYLVKTSFGICYKINSQEKLRYPKSGDGRIASCNRLRTLCSVKK